MTLAPISHGRELTWHPIRYSWKPVLYRNRGGGITFAWWHILYSSWKR